MPGVVAPLGQEMRPSGRQKALLIGINYAGTSAELRGCINDVQNVRKLLIETLSWRPGAIRILVDDDPHAMPTRGNIEAALRWLAGGAQSGDVLFFHFSGHGAQQEDPNGYEEDGMNETILPRDFREAGMITDDSLSDIIVKPLPEGVRLTAIMDCCHSGTGLDLPYSYEGGRGSSWSGGGGGGWREETNPYHSPSDVQLFSGCEDKGTSADASGGRYGKAAGAMSTAFCEVVRKYHAGKGTGKGDGALSYTQLLLHLQGEMKRHGFAQRPQLTSSQRFPLDRKFGVSEIVANSNATLGRTVRKKFKPQPRPMDAQLAGLLHAVGAPPLVAALGGHLAGKLLGHAGKLLG